MTQNSKWVTENVLWALTCERRFPSLISNFESSIMRWVRTYLRDDLYISIIVKFSCAHHGSISQLNMHSVKSVHVCSNLCLLKLHAWMYNTQQTVYQWRDLTLVQRFWATKVCLWASKIAKIRLFGRPIGRVTSWKAKFENYSVYSLIKWYQLLPI